MTGTKVISRNYSMLLRTQGKRAVRIIKKQRYVFGRLCAKLFATELTDENFLKRVWNQKKTFKNRKEIVNYFQHRREYGFAGGALEGLSERASADIIKKADEIISNKFDLFGTEKLDSDNRHIEWQCDIKTGYHWNPRKYYRDIEIPEGSADIKVPWELSRFQFLTVLGQAYKLTGDENYAEKFVEFVNDWIDSNKPKFGVNWACTMDVAIRVSNWILGFYYFKGSDKISEEFLFRFAKSIYQHGEHIYKNLETGQKYNSNHYLSDITGLVFIGTAFPEFKDAAKWREFGIKELKKEMEKQVYDDGCDFEASTCYHRLALELFFYSTYFVVVKDKRFSGENHIEVSEKIFGEVYTKKLYNMFDAVLYLLKPNGRMPQIGDNDSGQLFKLYPRKVLDMRYLLSLGAVFFKEQKWKINEFFQSNEDIAELLILYGKTGKNIWDSLGWNSLKNIKSKAFPDAGWYVMRDNKNYCIVSCGPNGMGGNGGHTHNDKLSFELCIDEEDIIVDPGTYVYTSNPGMRNKFRSTAAHNTVVIDGEEQNRFNKRSLFGIRDKAAGRCLLWERGEEYDTFIGEYEGYKRLKKPVAHQRKIKFYKKEGKLEITDRFEGNGEHNLQWNLILSPETKKLKIKSTHLKWHKRLGYYSVEYGVIAKTSELYSEINRKLPFNMRFMI